VFDGDGAAIMHLGNMAITASQAPKNYIHIVYNNGAHDSVGGQPTVGLEINLPQIGAAMGYKTVLNATNSEELHAALRKLDDCAKPALLQICVRKGNRKDLGRPTNSPQENKRLLMENLGSNV